LQKSTKSPQPQTMKVTQISVIFAIFISLFASAKADQPRNCLESCRIVVENCKLSKYGGNPKVADPCYELKKKCEAKCQKY